MATNTDDDGVAILICDDSYVQQISNNNNINDTEVDRTEQMSTNPTPPPLHNQPPAMGINISNNSSTGSGSRVVISVDVLQERYQPPSGSRNATASSVVILHGSTTGTRRGEPPSYDEAINPETPPPSYDSLFGRVREAHKSSTGILDFLKNVVILLLGTLGCTIILGITIVIPVTMIVFGSIYLYDCPQGEYIPVFLLVGGGFGVLKQLLHLSTRVRSREEQELERLRQSPTQTLINCFMLGWFIIGSFWIYKIYEPNYDPSYGKYCNKSLYLFTFWLITSVYIMLGIVTVVLCGVSIISIAIHRRT
ncbi:uncharacterized protein LOC129767982 [Toxorhynchites rutilus septentrionalis]|uniref:uncharacterized protein LOC129767982 n=1 Tax=Toxorhynchites rutilus septentrionalis TaxID=329112 RepID=UPI00247AAA1C|nr:uncharacterized protein LOC129767982 [Toxorhynchites rutilus septentrionalis]